MCPHLTRTAWDGRTKGVTDLYALIRGGPSSLPEERTLYRGDWHWEDTGKRDGGANDERDATGQIWGFQRVTVLLQMKIIMRRMNHSGKIRNHLAVFSFEKPLSPLSISVSVSHLEIMGCWPGQAHCCSLPTNTHTLAHEHQYFIQQVGGWEWGGCVAEEIDGEEGGREERFVLRCCLQRRVLTCYYLI